MSLEQLVASLQAASGDPNKLALITLDAVLASRGEAELRHFVDAAAIPHWFDAKILACCAELDAEPSETAFRKLSTLPMVEAFPAHGGMNVHEATRMALRAHLRKSEPDRFLHLSIRAADCIQGDEPHLQIEALYHRLVAEPEQGTDALRQLWSQWDSAGRYEALQSLGVVLEELLRDQALAPIARAQCILRFCYIRGLSLPLRQTELLCREAQAIISDSDRYNPHDSCDGHDILGGALNELGRWQEALAEYEAAKQTMHELTARDPDNAGWRHQLSVAHNKVGTILETQGKLPEALAEYQALQRIMQELTARDPDNAGWRRDLSVSHNNVGGVLQAQGKLPEALVEYEAGKRIRHELTARDPDNAGWRRDLSVSHNNVGGVLQAQGKLQEALAEYEAGKRIMQELTARDPDNAGWRRDLSVSHNNVGGVLQAQGKLQEALAEYEAGKRIMQELTARDPDNAGWRRDLSVSHNCVGGVLQAQRKLQEALAEYEASERILLILVAASPDQAEWVGDLRVTQELLNSARETDRR